MGQKKKSDEDDLCSRSINHAKKKSCMWLKICSCFFEKKLAPCAVWCSAIYEDFWVFNVSRHTVWPILWTWAECKSTCPVTRLAEELWHHLHECLKCLHSCGCTHVSDVCAPQLLAHPSLWISQALFRHTGLVSGRPEAPAFMPWKDDSPHKIGLCQPKARWQELSQWWWPILLIVVLGTLGEEKAFGWDEWAKRCSKRKKKKKWDNWYKELYDIL